MTDEALVYNLCILESIETEKKKDAFEMEFRWSKGNYSNLKFVQFIGIILESI